VGKDARRSYPSDEPRPDGRHCGDIKGRLGEVRT
jgi:hypothetical protein